jgi:hypothetical protein
MKQLTIIFLVTFLAQTVCAGDNHPYQDDNEIQTVFSKNNSKGGYGAFSIGYTELDNRDAILVGARGGWIINHSLAIGVGGYGFVNDTDYRNISGYDMKNNLLGGYGGLFLEPIIGPRLPVHLSFPVLFGLGGIGYVEHYDIWGHGKSRSIDHRETFWVIEPAVELEFNIARNFRLAATASYRFTSDIDLIYTDPEVLEGLTYGVVFKFGKF